MTKINSLLMKKKKQEKIRRLHDTLNSVGKKINLVQPYNNGGCHVVFFCVKSPWLVHLIVQWVIKSIFFPCYYYYYYLLFKSILRSMEEVALTEKSNWHSFIRCLAGCWELRFSKEEEEKKRTKPVTRGRR